MTTRDIILAEAERLIRTRGYAAFSYADLAEAAAIAKASVHHHFPTKEDLILVLLDGYMVRFHAALAAIRGDHTNMLDRLNAYADLFLDGFERGMLPLCGALSAERAALPPAMHPRIHHFFQVHLDWLHTVLEDGGITPPQATALLLLSTLEGGSFVGWAMSDKASVLAAFSTALRTLNPQQENRS